MIARVVTHAHTGEPIVQPLSLAALTRVLARMATWQKFDMRSGNWLRCDPPARHVSILFDAQNYPHLPPLAGLARQPFYRADGTLVTARGYDPASRLYGAFDPATFPVKRDATRDDALAALREINSLLDEFRFAADHDRAAALSAILTAVVRPSLPAAPLFHVRAPVMSSGKSYLCKVFTAFATPGPASPCSYPTTNEEATKVMIALLLPSPAVIEFDDLSTDLLPLNAINRALTEASITDRLLGASKAVTVSTRTLFLSSGNNVGPVRDMVRRVLTISLDPRVPMPATLVYHASPLDEVRRRRGHYVALALNIIQAWRNAGRPRADVPSIATYGKDWADYARHPLIWLGLPDPATALLEQLRSDPEAEVLGRIHVLWHERYGERPMVVRDVLRGISFGDDLYDALAEVAEEKGNINPGRLGWWIKRHEGRIVGDFAFRRAGDLRGRAAWSVAAARLTVSPVLTGFADPSQKIVSSSNDIETGVI